MGAFTPMGNSVEEFWAAAISGGSGIAPLTVIDTDDYPCKIGGEVEGFEPTEYMDRKVARRMARFSQFAVASTFSAIEQAGLNMDAERRERVGTLVGTGGGGLPNTDQAARTMLSRGGMKIDPLFFAKMLPNMAAANVTIQVGALGYSNTVSTACAAGTQAIGDAVEVIRRGAVGLAGFSTMRALTTSRNDAPETASRPFDVDRDGFAPAEGGAMFVLEEREHALARGAEPLAEISGYGVSADASYLVAPSEGGAGAARAMQAALDDAGLEPGQVDYISAHATATEAGDIAETEAVKHVFGEQAYQVPISAMKSQIGHLLGGSGAVETMAAIQSIRENVVAPTINLDNPDPQCDLDYVPNAAREADVRVALKNSFGFGGQNAVLVLQRYEG
jgi:3-oxoacyl-[acyl-carrier-protein] synthase II